MVSTRAYLVGIRLGKRRPTKLRGEKHQCIVEHATLLEVAKQAGDRLVDPAGLGRVVVLHILVRIPARAGRAADRAAGVNLHESHSALEQSPR